MKKIIKTLFLILIFLLSLSLTACGLFSNDDPSVEQKDTKYTVTFNYNNGTNNETIEVLEGSKAASPKNPTKKGYKFVGWYTDETLNNQYDFNSKVKSSFTLYAKWEENFIDNYTYGYVDNDVAIRTDVGFSKEEHQSANHKEFNCKKFNAGSYAISYNNSSERSKVDGFEFSCYRYGKIGDTVRLQAPMPNYDSTDYHGREGGVFNLTPFGGINKFTITYKASSSSNSNPTNPNVRFGLDDNCLDYVYFLDTTKEALTISIDLNLSMYQYFSINSGDYDTYITSFAVDYDNNTLVNNLYEKASGEDEVRINPVKYNFSLIPGVSKITAPISYEYDEVNDVYNVTSTKEFTYYTADYVSDHREVLNDATITDPMEVCIYYSLFGTWPANYSLNTNSIQYLFGNNTRKVSKYNRTDGYCRAIPWKGNGYYYELDIDVDGTYRTSSRGVGRVVVWENGWTEDGYDSSPVCIYTDDHYNTFIEYLNNGNWSKRFNAEGLIASISYSSAKTVKFNNFDSKQIKGEESVDNPVNPIQKQINNEDYYGNYAPATLINNSTAVFQKVTDNIGIIEGNSYIIVNEDYKKCCYNESGLIWNANNTISFYEEYSVSHKDLNYIYTFSFEKVNNNQYYMYLRYWNENYYYSVPSSKGDLVEIKALVNVTFDEYGNLNLYANNLYLRFNPSNDGLFRCYNQGSQQNVQLYRYCDIEGATPDEGENNQSNTENQLIYSNYQLVTNINDINSKNTYLLINPNSKKCLTDLNDSTYKVGQWYDEYPLLMEEKASFENMFFVKHENDISDYYEIYVLRDKVKYYLTYSKEDKTIQFSTELKTYYFISVSQDGTIKLSLVYLDEDYGYPVYVFDDNSWWYISFDEEKSKFIISTNSTKSTLVLYKTPIRLIETNYDYVDNINDINDNDTYIIVNFNDTKALTDLNGSIYEVVMHYDTLTMSLNMSEYAEFEELHIIKHLSNSENISKYYEIYVIRNNTKYYLSFNAETYELYYSEKLNTYYSIQFKDGSMYLLATKLVESNGKVIPVIITTDDTSYGWYLNYDSDLKQYVFTHEDGSVIYKTCIYLFKIID